MKSIIRLLILIPPLSHKVNPLIERKIPEIKEVSIKVGNKAMFGENDGFLIMNTTRVIIDGMYIYGKSFLCIFSILIKFECTTNRETKEIPSLLLVAKKNKLQRNKSVLRRYESI